MAGKYEGKRAKTRRPWEFKKKLAAWAVLIATATAVASYILAYLDKQTASDVTCLLYTSPSPRDGLLSRMPSSA